MLLAAVVLAGCQKKEAVDAAAPAAAHAPAPDGAPIPTVIDDIQLARVCSPDVAIYRWTKDGAYHAWSKDHWEGVDSRPLWSIC